MGALAHGSVFTLTSASMRVIQEPGVPDVRVPKNDIGCPKNWAPKLSETPFSGNPPREVPYSTKKRLRKKLRRTSKSSKKNIGGHKNWTSPSRQHNRALSSKLQRTENTDIARKFIKEENARPPAEESNFELPVLSPLDPRIRPATNSPSEHDYSD